MKSLLAKLALATVALAATSLAVSTASAAIPADKLLETLKPQGLVSDYAGVLSPTDRAALEKRLADLRQKTSAEFAVVILKSLEGGQSNVFARKLFAKWDIGAKGKNNGVLLLVAMQERKADTELGHGLDRVLPSFLANRVLDGLLFPAFEQQQYSRGLIQTVDQIAGIIERNEPAGSEEDWESAEDAVQIVMVICFSVFDIIGFGMLAFGIARRKRSYILWGIGVGTICLWVALATGGAVLLWLSIVAALTLFVGLRASRRTPRADRSKSRVLR